MKIIIETIPHETQRYTTVGDWFYDPDGTLHIKVSALSDWRHEVCVALHELVEVLLCKQAGVTQEAVDLYDKTFEENRKADDLTEPGDYPEAPYCLQHGVASGVERVLGSLLNVDWNAYADEVEALP